MPDAPTKVTRGFTLNDDGTITFRTHAGSEGSRTIVLPEPSMEQLAQLYAVYVEADGALPELPPLPTIDDDATPKQREAALATMREFQRVNRERTAMLYGTEAPYAKALMKTVEVLTTETVTMADLPSWTASPTEAQRLLSHFTTPLHGAALDE